ncbi:hypothetical protein P3T22_004391 [Paraburkholderia sp. GAS348]
MYEENDYCVFHMTFGIGSGIAASHTGPPFAMRPAKLTWTCFKVLTAGARIYRESPDLRQ